MPNKGLFVDLDGVLADFDSYFEQCFGVRPNQDTYEPPGMWDKIRAHGKFYRNLPMMKDALELWRAVCMLHEFPVILTGIPHSIPDVSDQKREWVWEHLGSHVHVVCCRSVDKYRYGVPGDVLVDDRLKYSHYWIAMGGVFIHHRNAAETIPKLGLHFGMGV